MGLVIHELGLESNWRLIVQRAVPPALIVPALNPDKELLLGGGVIGRDHFKNVVDTHGHLLGAKVLREVALVVHQQLGDQDRIVRYGGDEFVVILPGQTRAQALATTQRMREAVSLTPFLQAEGIGLRVTASFGLPTFPDHARDKKQLLLAADACLFRSKREGKNRVSA